MTRPRRELIAWRNAVFTVFAVSGFSFSTWLVRLPSIRDSLDLSTSGVGILIFMMSAGSVIGLVSAGFQITWFGARRAVLADLLLISLGLVLVGTATTFLGSPILAGVGLLFLGFGSGAVDVVINVEGAAAERELGKTSLPLMHGFFSVGTVGGAAVGALAAAASVPVFWHCSAAAVIVVLAAILAVKRLPVREVLRRDQTAEERAEVDRTRPTFRQRISVWADVRLVFIGIVMLGMAFTEGSANDWLTLATVDGHGQTETVGAVMFGIFTAAMTLGRVCGGPFIDRFGRVLVLQVAAGTAIVGLLMFILAPWTWMIVIGSIFWGLGASLGFPVGMSAAADDPAKATARVSAVAAIGYAAFLVGPPVLGIVGDHVGILNALYIVIALVILSGLASPAVRPLRRTPPAPPSS